MYCLFRIVLCIVVCKCVLPPGDNPIAVNKYIISYHIINEVQEANDITRKLPVSNQCMFHTVTDISWLIDESYLAEGKRTLYKCPRIRISQPSGRISTIWSASPALPFFLHDVPRALFAGFQLHL